MQSNQIDDIVKKIANYKINHNRKPYSRNKKPEIVKIPLGFLPGHHFKIPENREIDLKNPLGKPPIKSRNRAVGLLPAKRFNTHSSLSLSKINAIHQNLIRKVDASPTKSRSVERAHKL
mmetsp:Transcript_6695/g.6247  ORF Transcript_6695/g.6247 Transcript_6695/m.6247 type:complete len:119 (+) Transcript_6695:22-378(+)|eukprot:CAMPEP_0197004274 /NCGR_PEP_ID=MMETSP1380-20130617/21191_1 /TAXON_ID=5936 /ORGANISM="Euplotes crassus, Strain CT5" /LENGTH=118 /DNA_ID=CAMNT_0042423011 /DNA_START=14 /DNA_END=370 /DNA_ORIENTATION=-